MKLFVVLFLMSLQTFAADLGQEVLAVSTEKSFAFNWTSTRSYYACSYAEGQANRYLRALGAQNIQSDCKGGIEFGELWRPLDMNTEFTIAQQDDSGSNPATVQKVVLRGTESCDFNVKLIQAMLKEVPHKLIAKHSNCLDSQGTFRFELEVVK